MGVAKTERRQRHAQYEVTSRADILFDAWQSRHYKRDLRRGLACGAVFASMHSSIKDAPFVEGVTSP